MENSAQKAGEDATQKESEASPEVNTNPANDVQHDSPSDKPQDAGSAQVELNSVHQDVQNLLNNQVNEMDEVELKVKIICLEKNNLALKMDLKCAELQLQAKQKVEVQKNRLLELLDKKVSTLEKRNTHILDMLEGLIKDKEGHTNRLVEATKNMEILSTRLAESERMKVELRKMNDELKMMLGSLENKGSQIAKMAKDKIMKYKAEAIQMQQQLDDIKDKAATQDAENQGTPPEAAATAAADDEQTSGFQQHWKKIEDLQKHLEDAFQEANAGSLAEKVTGTNKEIKNELDQLQLKVNTTLDGNQTENSKLRAELGRLRLLVVELYQLSEENESSDKPSDPAVSTPGDSNAAEVEATRLREKMIQFKSLIEKMADLNVGSSPSSK